MIIVLFNKPEFEYDVHSLIKAFYPKEEVQMYYTSAEADNSKENLACAHHEAGPALDEKIAAAAYLLSVTYPDTKEEPEGTIALSWKNRETGTEIEKQTEGDFSVCFFVVCPAWATDRC